MGILLSILTAPISGPFKGLLGLTRLIQEQAEAALYDEDGLRAALLALEQRLEASEISEEEYDVDERVLLERLKISRDRARGPG
jgi:hypothetical protein